MTEPLIRLASPADAAAVTAIYAPYVRDTAISFETVPPDPAEMADRIGRTLDAHPWLVAESAGVVHGYAYGTTHLTRAAYRWSVDVSAYVSPDAQRTGVGRRLYQALLALLGAQGYAQAFAGITLPNDPSLGLHRTLGFVPVGTYRRVGWKFGVWHDVAWLQRPLGDDDGPPAPLR